MKSPVFSGLLIAGAVWAAYEPIKSLPDFPPRPPIIAPVTYRAAQLGGVEGPLRLAGAWTIEVSDPRFTGLSALAIDGSGLLAVSDRGAVVRFERPSATAPEAWIADLRDGPARWGEKWARDAESLARDPRGRGWWIGYEQNHSLWLYDDGFSGSLASTYLGRDDWRNNRGAEGLLIEREQLLVAAENGREAMRIDGAAIERLPLVAGADVADASLAPDGSAWLLLRSKGLGGIGQAVAPLIRTNAGYRAGPGWPVPKGMFDNYEGMAIEARPKGGWRFWLVTDDGHRVLARTLLVALDYVPPTRHDKSPAGAAGPSKQPSGNRP